MHPLPSVVRDRTTFTNPRQRPALKDINDQPKNPVMYFAAVTEASNSSHYHTHDPCRTAQKKTDKPNMKERNTYPIYAPPRYKERDKKNTTKKYIYIIIAINKNVLMQTIEN
jgi:hypothetical protein